MNMTYVPTRGKLKGLTHTPYQDKEGLYVVSPARFSINYIRVKTLEEAHGYLKKGLKIRMKYKNIGASLIKLSSIQVS